MNKKIIIGILICTLLITAIFLPVGGTLNVSKTNDPIPPIIDLAGFSGQDPGEVILTWGTPLFENPIPGEPFDASYDFRFSDVYIDNSNWDASTDLDGGFKAIVQPCVSVELDLWITSQVQGTTVTMDHYGLKAWLTVQFDCGNFYFPGGHGLDDETIIFEVYDPDDNLIYYNTDETDEHGMAYCSTGDLYDGPPACSEEKFHFKAYWAGHSVGVSNGFVISTGDREDSEDEYVCDGDMELPSSDHWSPHGGIYHGFLAGTTFEFTVSPGAVSDIVEVMLFSPSSVPPPNGMSPAVPDHMFPFQLEKQGGGPISILNKPIVITADYPASMLDQYGGLGESSLRGYRYNEFASQWEVMDDMPMKLNREHHRISFETDQLGLFSISAETDQDGDDLGDFEEVNSYYTNPGEADSDGDGISDGDEAWFTFSDPKDPLSKDNDDQHGLGENLEQGHGYYIAGRIVSDDVQSPISNCIYVEIGPIENHEPSAPDIDGQISGKAGAEYEYTFTSIDPDDDQISYYIKWGDGSITSWTDFQISGTPYSENHGWSEQDLYTIEAKAKDTEGAESDWATLKVNMPKNKVKTFDSLLLNLIDNYPIIYQLLLRFIKL